MTRCCVILILIAGLATADDKPKMASLAEKLEAIKKEHKHADDAFRKVAESLEDTPENQKKYDELWKTFSKGEGDRFTSAVELAKSDPKSADGFAALEWVLTIPRSYYLPAGLPAMKLVAEHHSANPKVGKLVAWIAYYFREEQAASYAAGQALIEAVAAKNPDRTARGQAHLARALKAGWAFAAAEYKRSPDAEKMAAQAEAAFEAIVKDYDNCPRLVKEKDVTLGEFARAELFELRHLRIGKVAPELEGEDLDAKKFKLSDSRGKVTLVVFWASWCGPCMVEVPHEKKLVERLKDKPFVLIGVNGDDDRAKAKRVTLKEGMTWRSFWNGKDGPHGPISRAWNVREWPTVYVLDEKGVIRFKHIMGKEQDEAVDQLLKKLDK